MENGSCPACSGAQKNGTCSGCGAKDAQVCSGGGACGGLCGACAAGKKM